MEALQLPWISPLDLASGMDDPYWVLLYSGAQTNYSGRYSLLACDVAERVEGGDFSSLEKKLSTSGDRFANAWFGYLGYGLKNTLEQLNSDAPGWIALPDLSMMRFHTIYEFDHEKKTVRRFSDRPTPEPAARSMGAIPAVMSLQSNMSKEVYLQKVAHVIDRIHAGDLYQANLTRKFSGEFAAIPQPFDIFRTLCRVSPAPYSAFLRLGEISIASSSPELFLRLGNDGSVTARPIKGTAPRFEDNTKDEASRKSLEQSSKDRAENLMIVDLMRNDLSRTCVPGSIRASRMFEVTSHATIHHMSSTISGTRRAECAPLDTVKQCFPPGSMTGAPKIMAMNLCSELERQARGIYSGAIGYFAGDGSAELSVVIRTLVLKGKAFEFQVGGGIVSDSTPERELDELIDKARGIALSLHITKEQLRNL